MTVKKPIYLDYHATTPVDPRVFAAMQPYFAEMFGNPASSTHSYGWQSEAAVERARSQVANLIGAKDREIIFTSGATESNNLAILGAIGYDYVDKPHFITSQIEHSCVLSISKELERRGVEVTYLPVSKYGQVEPEVLKKSIKPNTKLISIMFANNEIGTINQISTLSQIAHEKDILFHVDAAQAVGKIEVDVNKFGIDLMSISAHKIYGPKGAGALFVRSQNPKVRLSPVIFGGGQERGIRPGTLNVPGYVGLGYACEICKSEMATEAQRTRELRDKLAKALSEVGEIIVNGHPTDRLPINLNVSFSKCMPDLLLENLRGVAVSSGSACSSASMSPSHVLKAIGVSDELARSTLRFGIGRFTTNEDLSQAIDIVREAVKKCRSVKYKEQMT